MAGECLYPEQQSIALKWMQNLSSALCSARARFSLLDSSRDVHLDRLPSVQEEEMKSEQGALLLAQMTAGKS